MGATRVLKNYTQEQCEEALIEGFSVGVIGEVRPATDKIKTPHEIQEVKVDGKVIGYNVNKLYLAQSDNWDKYFNIVSENPDQRIVGFPFSVRFPKMYLGKKYSIILVSGVVMEAKVDDAREFMSEGLEWKTIGGNKSSSIVAAWKELWQR
ncbi:MAG: hypothetical protein WCK37_04905 [Candidatus Falkowbacteria bacterium]